MDENRIVRILTVVVLVIFCCAVGFFWKFTAEDAFIVCRYAENFADYGLLHFNIGEPLQAFTSPLQLLLQSVLSLCTRSTVSAWKIVGLLSWVAVAVMATRPFKRHGIAALAAAVLLLMPPCSVLWTVGGLETPLLGLWITCMTLLVYQSSFSSKDLLKILVCASLAFVTRYDSVLFSIPLAAYSMNRNGKPKQIAAAAAIAVIIPTAWLAFAWSYFGDIFPTSFYAKTPSFHPAVLSKNLVYVAQWLLLCGVAPLAIISVVACFDRQKARFPLGEIFRLPWLSLALLIVLGYTLTCATTHMMFSFRSFVPYLPAAAILISDSWVRAFHSDTTFPGRGSSRLIAVICLGIIIVFNAVHLWYTYEHSLNGFTQLVGEYRRIGVRAYSEEFLEILRTQALEIQRHWLAKHPNLSHPPRIFTFAAGALPYQYRSAYIYELLVSYRHNYPFDVRWAADYTHVLVPRHGNLENQLVKSLASYELISRHQMIFDGNRESFMVFYDPNPDPHTLPKRIIDTISPLPSEEKKNESSPGPQ